VARARERSELALAIVNVAAFAGALVALAAGAPADRLRPLAAFCGLGTAAVLYVEVAHALARRRADAQATFSPPLGVRLSKPLWLSAIDGASLAQLAAPLAGLAGVAGFPNVGLGVLLTAGALLLAGFALAGTFTVDALAFEEEGLRVHVRGATFFVRWDTVVDVTREGTDGRLVRLHFTGTEAVLASVAPATDRARSRAMLAIEARMKPTPELLLGQWTAGLDASALARALTAARRSGPSRVN
jgi:hypothetical protein